VNKSNQPARFMPYFLFADSLFASRWTLSVFVALRAHRFRPGWRGIARRDL
jgi:hypothetical protein